MLENPINLLKKSTSLFLGLISISIQNFPYLDRKDLVCTTNKIVELVNSVTFSTMLPPEYVNPLKEYFYIGLWRFYNSRHSPPHKKNTT